MSIYRILLSFTGAFTWKHCRGLNYQKHTRLNGLLVVGSSLMCLDLSLFRRIAGSCSSGGQWDAFLNETHLSRKSRVGNPPLRLARSDLFEHSVNLFERKTLGLRNQEIGESYADDAEGTPHEENLGR